MPGAHGFVEVDRPIRPTRMGDMVRISFADIGTDNLKDYSKDQCL